MKIIIEYQEKYIKKITEAMLYDFDSISKTLKVHEGKHSFIFLLVPPYQGSTVLYKLISTSENVSTLLNSKVGDKRIWAGEGQAILREYLFDGFNVSQPNKVDSELTYVDMDEIFDIYSKYWDMNKPILCEKSPSLLHFAPIYEKYFSKYGKVYFISMIRDPYAINEIHYNSERWVSYAELLMEFHKNNKIKNKILLKYEEFTNDVTGTIMKIKDFIPELNELNPDVSEVSGVTTDRAKNIENYNEITNVEHKNKVLNKNKNILEYFGYQLR